VSSATTCTQITNATVPYYHGAPDFVVVSISTDFLLNDFPIDNSYDRPRVKPSGDERWNYTRSDNWNSPSATICHFETSIAWLQTSIGRFGYHALPYNHSATLKTANKLKYKTSNRGHCSDPIVEFNCVYLWNRVGRRIIIIRRGIAKILCNPTSCVSSYRRDTGQTLSPVLYRVLGDQWFNALTAPAV